MAMLSLGTFALIAVVGAALFGGFDPRKKKKNGAAQPEPTPEAVPQDTLIDCASIVDFNADGSRVSIDGNPSIPVETYYQNIEDDVLQLQAPVVMVTMCQPDPVLLDVMEELCEQRPDIVFLATYVYRLEPGPLLDQVIPICQSGMVAMAQVIMSPEPGVLRMYPSEAVAELQLREGGDIAQFVANLIAFADGAPHESMVESA